MIDRGTYNKQHEIKQKKKKIHVCMYIQFVLKCFQNFINIIIFLNFYVNVKIHIYFTHLNYYLNHSFDNEY